LGRGFKRMGFEKGDWYLYFEQIGKGMLCTYVLFDAASVERNNAS
jgi:hypothetical protein